MSNFLINVSVICFAASSTLFNTRELIEQALDEPTQIKLENVRLADAIDEVTKQTGVRVEMPPDVMRLAPHGAETILRRVDLSGLTLREGLGQLFHPLGMRFVVQDDHVAIEPAEGIACLGRAPTWVELDTLRTLREQSIGTDDGALVWLKNHTQMRVPVEGAWSVLSHAVQNVGSGEGDEILSVATENLGWAWCVEGENLVVEGLQDRHNRKLEKLISIRLNNRPLVDVLSLLGREVGIDIRSEPGVLADLPVGIQKNFSINVVQQPASTVLEHIAAYTGLGYLVEPNGVLFFSPDRLTNGEFTASQGEGGSPVRGIDAMEGDPYVAKLLIPLSDGTTLEWLIRRSELPPDLRGRRSEDIRKAFEELREQP